MINKNEVKPQYCTRCAKAITNDNWIALTQHSKYGFFDIKVYLCEKCKKKWFKFIGRKIEW